MAASAAAGKAGVIVPADDKAARYAHLLNPIRDLAQNWNIDVARDLEDYLEDLESIEISFDGGITSLNFAEAARLIQGSACVYSRKVEYLYTLIYQALELLSAQTKKKKGAAGDGANAVDADAAALEEEAREEFLLLDDLVKESAHVDLNERPEDVAAALDMTLAYCGGAGATPAQRRHAAAAVARTPLYVMASSRFDRRDEGAADFLLQACTVSRAGALLLEAPPLPSRAGGGGFGGFGHGQGHAQLQGQAHAHAHGSGRDDGSGAFALALCAPAAPAMLADLSIAPIGHGDRSGLGLGASGQLLAAALSASGRMIAAASSAAGTGDAAASAGKSGKHVSFAAPGHGDGMDVDGPFAANGAGTGAGAGAPGDGPLAAPVNGLNRHDDDDAADEDDGNGYLVPAYGTVDEQQHARGDDGEGYGDRAGDDVDVAARHEIAADDGDDLDHVPLPGAGAGAGAGAGSAASAQSYRARMWQNLPRVAVSALGALGIVGPAAGSGTGAGAGGNEPDGPSDKWAQLDPLADAGPASHRPYRKGRPFLKLRNSALVSHRGPQAAAAAEMAAAAADGNRGIGDARQLAALARTAAAEASVNRVLGTGAGTGLFRGATGKGASARAAAAEHTVSMALALASVGAGAAATGGSPVGSAGVGSAGAASVAAAAGSSALRLSSHVHALGSSMLHTLAQSSGRTASSSGSGSGGGSGSGKSDPLAPMLLTTVPLALELEPRVRLQKAAALQARLQARRAEAKRSAKAAAAGAAYAQTAMAGDDDHDDEYGLGHAEGAGAGAGDSDPYAAAFLGGHDDDDGAGYGDTDDALPRGDGFGDAAVAAVAGSASAAAHGAGEDATAAGAANAAGGAAGGDGAARSAAAAAAGAGRSLFSWLDDAAAGADLVRGDGLNAETLLGKLGLLGDMDGDEDDENGGRGVGFGGVSYADLVRQHMRAIEANVRDAAAFASETGMAKRVTVWQERLEPLLGEEERRREFDVHVYGDEVLGRLLREAVASRSSGGAAAAAASSSAGAAGGSATRDLSAVAESAEGEADTSADASQPALAMPPDHDDNDADEDDVDPETGRPLRSTAHGRTGAAAPASAEDLFTAAAAGGSPLPAVDFGRVVPRTGERWEVCRSFLATLMLANAGNVLILPPSGNFDDSAAHGGKAAAAASTGAAPSRNASSRGAGRAAGKAGSTASTGGDAAGDAWLFSQAIPYHADDAEQERAVAAAATAGRVRSGAGGVMSSFEGPGSEAAFAARVATGASFGLRLLNPSRRLVGDAFEEHQAELHSGAGAGAGAAERRPRKRGAEEFAAAGAAGKRTAVEDGGSGAPVARSNSSGGSGAAARAASGSPVRTGTGRARSGGAGGRKKGGNAAGQAPARQSSFDDELLDDDGDGDGGAGAGAARGQPQPPSPVKPGELASPLHKRLRRTGPISPGSPGAGAGTAAGGKAAGRARRGFRGGAAAAGDSSHESVSDSESESDYGSDGSSDSGRGGARGKGKAKGQAAGKTKGKGKVAAGKGKDSGVSSMAARLQTLAPPSGR